MKKYKKNSCGNMELKSIECDACGYKVKGKELYEDKDFISIVHHFGYGSKYDTDKLYVDLCEDCLMQMFDEFNVNYTLQSEIYD